MADKSRGSKRKREEEEEEEEEEEDITTVEHQWLDEGVPRPDGSTLHKALRVSFNNKTFVIRQGDTVMLRSSDKQELESPSKSSAFVARVELMWEDPDSKTEVSDSCVKFRARWFFKKSDLAMIREEFEGPVTRRQLLDSMGPRDVVLSNQTDENDVLTMLGPCHVLYRKPDPNDIPPDSVEEALICRYSVSFGTAQERGKVVLEPYEGENDDWEALDALKAKQSITESENAFSMELDNAAAAGDSNDEEEDVRGGATEETRSGLEETASSSDSSVSSSDVHAPEAEGSTTKGKIRVGTKYQATVQPFVPNQPVLSRGPTSTWTPGSISSEQLDEFFARVESILVAFMEENGIARHDPYSPLPSAKVEELHAAGKLKFPVTLSTVSTASALSSESNKLPRESKVEALLEVLREKNFSVEDALEVVKATPHRFLTVWTKPEVDLFDGGFRKYSGSLYNVSKGIGVTKTFKDVVDFHYRFKIPDNFRRFQNKKREHAVRMMECIETRRFHDSVVLMPQTKHNKHKTDTTQEKKNVPKESGKMSTDWSKTGSSDVVGAVDERRMAAKELLLDIQKRIGDEKMVEVTQAIRKLHSDSISGMKEGVFNALRDHPDLLNRFVDFLPRRFRTTTTSTAT